MKIKMKDVNLNAAKKIATYVLVGSLTAATLTGCGKKESLLEGTILNRTQVVTLEDGTKDIIKASLKTDFGGNYYRSIVSGMHYYEENNNYGFIKAESINNYLNKEELTAAVNGELSDEDVANIVDRIINSELSNDLSK